MSRTIILGAPGVGKRKLANLVHDKRPHIEVQREPGHTHPNAALGALADYRTELSLALDRAWFMERDHTISTHSLIDSFGYTFLRIENGVEYMTEAEVELWLLNLALIGKLAEDSLRFDNIFVLTGASEETSYIEELLLDLLFTFELPYVELSGNLQEDAELIAGAVDGQGTDLSES